MDAGVAVASAEMGYTGVAQTVGVPAQTLHEGGRGGTRERAGARVLARNSHPSHAEARLSRIQPGNKLRRVACVSPHQRPVVAHVRGGQGEERLARLVRRNWRDASGTEARLRRLRFTSPLMVGATVRAAVTAVCAGSSVAGVSIVWTVRVVLIYIRVLFWVIVIAARAGRTAPLMCSVSIQSLGV